MLSATNHDLRTSDSLKFAMRHMPSPVAIVSTIDPQTSLPCGLAMTAYGPVSMDPPSMQVCINRTASAYNAILNAGIFVINVLGGNAEEVLSCFSDPDKKAERFAEYHHWKTSNGMPYLHTSNSAIFCRIATKQDFGSHTLIIGVVDAVIRGPRSSPAVWLAGKLHSVERD